jgi:hypothetical protein
MKRYEMKVRPAVQESVLVEVLCDLCGKRIPHNRGYGDLDEVTVEHRSGVNYPEGGDVMTRSVDVCPACFEGRLVPFLESQGATVAEVEVSY